MSLSKTLPRRAVLLLPFAMAACAVGPEYKKPQLDKIGRAHV